MTLDSVFTEHYMFYKEKVELVLFALRESPNVKYMSTCRKHRDTRAGGKAKRSDSHIFNCVYKSELQAMAPAALSQQMRRQRP